MEFFQRIKIPFLHFFFVLRAVCVWKHGDDLETCLRLDFRIENESKKKQGR